MQRILILLALFSIIVLPLAFRKSPSIIATGEDTLIVISPHPENNQAEFKAAFEQWYYDKTQRTVKIDWRYPGGLSDILKIVDSLYDNAFQTYWEQTLKRPWTQIVKQYYNQDQLLGEPQKDNEKQAARRAFIEAPINCGMDIFFGGGGQEFELQKAKGQFQIPTVVQTHPEWFIEDYYPLSTGGFKMRDIDNQWFGVVFSSYGIAYNKKVLNDLKLPSPTQWEDLIHPLYCGELALGDPSKSGSVKQSFEMLFQTQMQSQFQKQRQLGSSIDTASDFAKYTGWIEGLKLIQKMAANTRYFTEKSNKPILSIASGNCAAGMVLDFAALCQKDNLKTRHSHNDFEFISPKNQTAYTPDCIALFKGAPNPTVANLFIEFVLSEAGQKLWAYQAQTPGGPQKYTLQRLPICKNFYKNPQHIPYRSDPQINPYKNMEYFDYHAEWTEPLLSVFHKIIRIAFIDPQLELTAAWKAIQNAYQEGRQKDAEKALSILEDFDIINYTAAIELKQQLSQRDPLLATITTSRLTEHFIQQYKKAKDIANHVASTES